MERPILCQKKGKLEMQPSKRKIQQLRQKITLSILMMWAHTDTKSANYIVDFSTAT